MTSRNIFLLTLLLSFCATLKSQSDSAALALESVIEWAKENSLYSAETNWILLEEEMRSRAESAGSISELQSAFSALINGLRDHHGRVVYQYRPIAHFINWDEERSTDDRPRDRELGRAIGWAEYPFEHEMLDDKTGYLRVVGVAPDADIQMVAESIRAAVEELGRKGAEHWVLDLRYNGGGNIYPMMAGLAPLFGDGLVGQAVDAEGEVLAKWFFEGGQYFREGYQANVMPLSNLPAATPQKPAGMNSLRSTSCQLLSASTPTAKGNVTTRQFLWTKRWNRDMEFQLRKMK